MKLDIPEEIIKVAEIFEKAGFEAYLVGGCVRNLLLGRKPKDWDIATSAKPEEIQGLFQDSVYENQFGTVLVKTGSENPALAVVEITTFRIEGKYTDKRHPDEVGFAKTIEEDLSRRDFTVNALALPVTSYQLPVTGIVDPYGGQEDLKKKTIRAVGNAGERFEEDALRLLRAIRLAAELGFSIEENTWHALQGKSALIEFVAKERVRDEFSKLVMTPFAGDGVRMLENAGLLQFIVPELREGIGCGQNKHHVYTVFDHNVRALQYTADKDYSLGVRLAAFLHDVGKPRTKRGEGPDSTFHNHEYVGAKMTAKILDRLRFGKEAVEYVTHLVRSHLFYYNVGEVTEAGVRRFLVRVGPENVDDLLKVREADRIGSGVPKAFPYKLRHLLFMIEKVKHDPIHPKMLEVDGEDVMKILQIPPGPKIGAILNVLLEEVLDDPTKNTRENLEVRIENLGKMDMEELQKLSEKAREKKEEFESGVEEEMKKKYYVK